MYTVTLPNGKRYTYGMGRWTDAYRLATRTGGTLDVNGPRVDDYPPVGSRCPHGSRIGMCDRGACDER